MKIPYFFLKILFCLLLIPVFLVPAAADGPSLSAGSFILMEAETGEIVCEENADQRRPIASTTKMMTALVALETASLSDVIVVPQEAVGKEGSSVYLVAGERLTVEDLLYATLLSSANDAATALAIGVGGSEEAFVAAMNRRAESLGMTNTHFDNPHGLDSETHFSTARDLCKLAQAAMQNPDFARIVSTTRAIIPRNGAEGVRVLLNHNRLLSQLDGALGIKTGFTKKSGRCLVSAARRDGVTLLAVTLNDPDDWRDHAALYECGFARYRHWEPVTAGDHSYEVELFGAEKETVHVENQEGYAVTLPAGEHTWEVEADLPHYLYPPISEGEVLGHVHVKMDGETVADIPLVATESVAAIPKKPGFFEGLFSHIR